jgi:hypothetical protein
MFRYLRILAGLIWLLIGGGAILFIGCTLLLAALHPTTPAYGRSIERPYGKPSGSFFPPR